MTREIEITESAVEYLGELRVGAGSIFEDDYELPDGSTARGLTCRLVAEDDETPIVVGEGSEVELGGIRWAVTRVTDSGEEPFEYGAVVLREISAAD